MANIIVATIVAGALVAAYTDVRTRRIPNLITGALAVFALAAHATGGITGVVTATLVMSIVFAVGTVAFSLRWFGGGDVKLLAACCGLAGYPGAISLVLYTLVAGGLVAIVDSARQRKLRSVITGTFMTTLGVAPGGTVSVPYGVAIAIGACTYALSVTTLQFLRLPL